MGSAETSGVIGKGFGADATASFPPRHQQTAFRLSPASLAITLSAFAGLILFAVYDIHRTFTETRARIEMAAMLAASEMAPRELDAPRSAGFAMQGDLRGLAQFAIVAEDGEVLASTIPDIAAGTQLDEPQAPPGYIDAHAPISGGLGHVLIGVPFEAIVPQIAWRNGGLLFGALVLAFFTIRREHPQPIRQPNDLEPAIDAIPYGLAHWSADGKLMASNTAFKSLLGLNDRSVRRGIAYLAVSGSITGQISARPVLDDNRQRVVEIERDNGNVVLLDERACAEGGFVSIVTDITDRCVADRMLAAVREDQRVLARRYHDEKIRAEAASRAKTAFLAHLSHDIRTPLNHIIGFTDLIGMETYGPLGDDRYGTYLRDIRQAGERLLKCFGDVLEFAELEGGRKMLKCEPVALGDLIEHSASRFASRAARAGLNLDVRAHAAGYLAGDRQCLARMLDNLLENAIRHTPRGGEIRLAVWAADDGVVLEVSDTGIGMAEELLSRLSQPFALPDATCAKSHDGVGLGIAIARAIAEASGGRLVIDSMPDTGTTVAISLPVAEGLPAIETIAARAA
jgi:two-component system, cell cycle sensor histidine kinase PleC